MINIRAIIGFAGKMTSGKGAAAETLQSHYPHVYCFSLADPIKKCAQLVYGLPQDILWGKSEKRVPHVRKTLQTLGDWGRELDPYTWVNHLASRISKWKETGVDSLDIIPPIRPSASPEGWDKRKKIDSLIIIPDVRLTEEAAFVVQQLQGKIIKIERPMVARPVSVSEHKTETGVDIIPSRFIYRTLINEGPLDKFKGSVLQVVDNLLQGVENEPSTRNARKKQRHPDATARADAASAKTLKKAIESFT